MCRRRRDYHTIARQAGNAGRPVFVEAVGIRLLAIFLQIDACPVLEPDGVQRGAIHELDVRSLANGELLPVHDADRNRGADDDDQHRHQQRETALAAWAGT